MQLKIQGRKGYLIPAALSILVVLLVLVIANSWREGVSKGVKHASAADCQAEQAVANALARTAMDIQAQPIPGTAAVNADASFSLNSGLGALDPLDKFMVYGQVEGMGQPQNPMATEKLYAGKDQPQVGGYDKAALKGKMQGKNRVIPPWVTETSIKPTSSRREYSDFGARRHEAAFHEGFSFAAYAPQGKIEMDEVRSWTNPLIKEMESKPSEKSQEQASGLPCWVAAKKSIKIDTFAHGRAYLDKAGTMSIKGGAVGLPGLPLPAGTATSYDQLLLSDLDAAYNALRATGIDKTGLIFGRLDITSFLALFKGSEFPNIFSLESALGFYFPTIPEIKNQGAYTELKFHVPLPPDQNLENVINGLTTADTYGKTIEELNSANQQMILLKQDRQKKVGEQAKYASNSSEYKKLADEIKEIDQKIADKQKEIDDLSKKIKNVSDGAHDAFSQGVQDGKIEALRALPETRAEEKALKPLLTAKGWKGFSYIGLFVDRWADLVEIVTELIGAIFDSDGFDPDVLLKMFFKEVRLVHLGPGRPEPTNHSKMFQKSPGGDLQAFAIDQTWTVPRGRTFRIQTTLHLKGDLWVQRGACMIVDKDLIMTSKGGTTPFEPKGRIYLEEGATLMVGGNIFGAGDSTFGSLVIGCPVGREHDINTAIICQGKVQLPYGTRPGISLDDLARGLEEEFKFSGVSDVLEVILTDIYPNVSKLIGPFHMRACYFAQWTTTIIIPNVFPVPIPAPIPDNKHKNQLCMVFRALTMLYTVHLNATLGENLMTAGDLWLIGKERVAMVPKIDPFALYNHAKTFFDTLKNLAGDMPAVEKALKIMGEDLLAHLVQDVVRSIIVEFICNQLIQGFMDGLSPIAGFIYSVTLADEVDAKVTALVDDTYGKMTNDLLTSLDIQQNGSVDSFLNYCEQQFLSASADTLLPESPGVLIYGKEGVEVQGLLATGWFVSQKNVQMDTLFTVGAVMSTGGDIQCKTLLYNPYFTKASLYLPATLLPGGPGIDDLDDFWANAVNFKYGKTLHNDRGAGAKAIRIGRKSCFQSAAGWSPR